MGRAGVQRFRRADLAHHAIAQHHDAIGQRQGLVLVVGHVDRGTAKQIVDAADLGPHLQPQLGVEIGQRFVHQHQRRLHHDGACDGHALLLPTADLARQLLRLGAEAHQLDRLLNLGVDLGLGTALHTKPEADVAADVHVREQRVVLEHHAETAILRRQQVDPLLVQPHAASGQRQQSREAVQRGRLAAAGRPEQGDELAPPDRQVDTLQRVEQPEIAAHAP